MSVNTSFAEINKYFYSHCTDEDKKIVNTDKAKQYLMAIFSEYITSVDNNASINYDTNILITNEVMTEVQKNLLSLFMYREHYQQKLTKYEAIVNIVADSHKLTGTQDRVSNTRKTLEKIENKINDMLATML